MGGSFDSIALGPYAEVLKDEGGSLTLDEILQPEQQARFESIDAPILSAGFTNAVYWIRFSLQNPTNESTEWLLNFPFRTMDDIEFHHPAAAGGYGVRRAGDVRPLAAREIAHPHFLFRVEMPAGARETFYLRMQSNGGAMVAPLILFRPSHFVTAVQSDDALWGVTFGLFGILAAYGLFHALSLRDTGHLHYALMVLALISCYLILSGWGNFYVWGNWSYPVNNELPRLWMVGSIFLLQSFRSLLDSRDKLPRMDWVLRGGTYLAGGGAAISWLFSYGVQIQAGLMCMMLSLLLGTIASVLRWRQGYEPALFALVGGGAMIGSAIFNNFRLAYGEAPINGIDIFSLAGGWVEALLFSFGFSSRYKLLRAEKERIQSEKLAIQNSLVGELQRASQLKDDFLANTSHELRTPLHGIIGLCQSMDRDDSPLSSTENRRNLDLIVTSAQRLSHLVGDIMDFSRLKNQDLRLNQRDFDLRGSIQMTCRMCETAIGTKPVKLELTVPSTSLRVHADEDRVQQVLFNLLGNAIKFTAKGTVNVSAELMGDRVVVRVTDTGIGISPHKQAEIFQPFVQADGSISREYGGTGLGLAISQQLVGLHGSTLAVDSAPGEGSTFSFALPVARSSSEALPGDSPSANLLVMDQNERSNAIETPTPDAETAVEAAKGALVLIVDDEPLNIEVLKSQLRRENYRVTAAMDGVQALEVLEAERPDLILLDLMMPRMDGYETCRRIRESNTAAELPIIILTARGQMEDLVRGLRAGANDYLSKPFYQEELLARIRSQLAQLHATEVLRDNERLAERLQHFRQTETVLKASERRLMQILGRSKEAVLVVDGRATITYASPVMAEVLGYGVEDLAGRSWLEIGQQETALEQRVWPPEEQDWTATAAARSSALRRHDGGIWKCQMWGAELDLGEEAWLFSFLPRDGNVTTSPPRSLAWLHSLEVHRTRVRRLVDNFQELPELLMERKPELLAELAAIDAAIGSLSSHLEPADAPQSYATILVQVMTDTINCWEAETGKTMIEMAEASGIWAVNIDDGRLRARSMERYLHVDRLPQRPRWRNVIKTAHFVLSRSTRSSPLKERLNTSLELLLQSTHRRNLLPSSVLMDR